MCLTCMCRGRVEKVLAICPGSLSQHEPFAADLDVNNNINANRLSQEKKKGESEDSNKLVQGVLTFSIREAYGDMPDEPPEGEGSGGEVMIAS